MPVESNVAVGTTIAEYVVEELIGSGGMGEVYRARDERLGRRVALKVLLRRLADDAGFRERLLRESRLAASLDHPNVVPVYEAGEADGTALHRDAVRRRHRPEGAAAAARARSSRLARSRSRRRSRTRSTPRTRSGSSTAT